MVPCESAWLLPKTKRKKTMETAALCKPIQRSADLLRIPGTWVLTGLGKLLAVLGSFPQFRTASTTASNTSFWRFLECPSIEATLTQNGHLTHHEIPSVASLRPGGHFPRIGWPVSPEYAAWGAVALLKGKIAGSLFRYQNRRKWVTFALAKSKGGDAMLAKIGVLLAMLLGAFGIGGDDPRGRDE